MVENTPYIYRESWLANVPATRTLKIYLSSSSDIQQNYTQLNYDIPNNKWRNFVATTNTDTDAFNIQKIVALCFLPFLIQRMENLLVSQQKMLL